MNTRSRTAARTSRPVSDITLVHIDAPAIRRDDRRVALPIHSWLSAGFWDLFGLPEINWSLSALAFGTPDAPRTYFARHPGHPTTWTAEPLTVDVPLTVGPGPGVLEVSGRMTWQRRRMTERTTLVIALSTPGDHRLDPHHPDQSWESDNWHTTVLVPSVRPGAQSPLRYNDSW